MGLWHTRQHNEGSSNKKERQRREGEVGPRTYERDRQGGGQMKVDHTKENHEGDVKAKWGAEKEQKGNSKQ